VCEVFVKRGDYYLCLKKFVAGKKRVICPKKFLAGEGYIACA